MAAAVERDACASGAADTDRSADATGRGAADADPGADARRLHPAPRRAAALVSWLAVALLVALALAAVGLRLIGWQPLAVLSDSMAPTLREGDLIVVAEVPASAVAVGDVIAFARPGHPGERLTHRVVALRRGAGEGVPPGWLDVVTRGDAARALERWTIPLDGTVGELRARIPAVGTLAAPLRGELSRAAAIALATAALAGAALWLIWHPRRGTGAAR